MSGHSDEDDNPQHEARYTNCLEVGHNAFEFIFIYGQNYPESGISAHTYLVTGPRFAKAFLETLRDAVERYEQEFGVIGDF